MVSLGQKREQVTPDLTMMSMFSNKKLRNVVASLGWCVVIGLDRVRLRVVRQ